MATAAGVFALSFAFVMACGGTPEPVLTPPPVPTKPKVQHRVTPMSVLSVTTTRGRSEADLKEDLLLALDGASFDGVTRKFNISASLVTLDAVTSGATAVTKSTVEITVVDDTGKVLGTARGNARVEAEVTYADAAADAVRRACEEAVTSSIELARQAR